MNGKMQLPKRMQIRLDGYDYNSAGAYFITVCTKERKQCLCDICVGTGVLDGPKISLSHYEKIQRNI